MIPVGSTAGNSEGVKKEKKTYTALWSGANGVQCDFNSRMY